MKCVMFYHDSIKRKSGMKKIIFIVLFFLGFGFTDCKKENNSDRASIVGGKMDIAGNLNMISIIEIPVTNLKRAIQFYQTILGIRIETMAMGETEMGVLPAKEGSVNVVFVKGNDYIPAKNGVLVYLNLGNDLQPALDQVEKNGGKIILPKTLIDPQMGYYALFVDSEGNKMGMHSQK